MKAALQISLAALLFAGCAADSIQVFSRPQYGASEEFMVQWNRIQRGMTVGEVHRALGVPSGSYRDGFGFQRVEYWKFTPDHGRPANLLEAFRVWFGPADRVQAWEQPKSPELDL